MRGLPAAIAIALAIAPFGWAAAAHGQDRVAPDSALATLQARDARLFAVGWRLATANAPYCEGAVPSLGLAVLDAGGFGDPAKVRRQLRLSGDIAIGSIGPDSPAARAGLKPNDTLIALNGVTIADRFPAGKPAWQRLIDVAADFDAAAALGQVSLVYARAGAGQRTAVIDPVPACASRFEVLDGGGKAMAEGTRVIFGRDFPAFSYPEAEFAAAVSHEFAHNLLHHRMLLDARGRSLGNVRLTEREADRLMPWLLANAGYDPEAALRFMERWGPRHGGGLFRARTHEGWDERADAIRAELARIEMVREQGGAADWSTHFQRETLRQR